MFSPKSTVKGAGNETEAIGSVAQVFKELDCILTEKTAQVAYSAHVVASIGGKLRTVPSQVSNQILCFLVIVTDCNELSILVRDAMRKVWTIRQKHRQERIDLSRLVTVHPM